MTTTITISQYSVKATICGITIKIDRDELFESVKTIRAFYENVIPEKHKEDIRGSQFEEILTKIEQYQPFAERFLRCWSFEQDSATSTITINEDGTIDFNSTEQTARFDFKKYLQVMSDLSDFESEQRKAEAEERAKSPVDEYNFQDKVDEDLKNTDHLTINCPISSDHFLDILEDCGYSNKEIHEHLVQLQGRTLNAVDIQYIVNKFDLKGKVYVNPKSTSKHKQVIEPGIAVHDFYNEIEEKNLSTPEIVKYFQDKKSIAGRMYYPEISDVIYTFNLQDHFICGSDLED